MVSRIVAETPVLDIHTHLYAPAFGDLVAWGVNDLLTYHYLVAESRRQVDLPIDKFWLLSKQARAELIWRALFVDHSPISEACRGVVTTLNHLGLDPRSRDLAALRAWFANWKPSDYIDHCMLLAGVEQIVMTNSPFGPVEAPIWQTYTGDSRFAAALRIDPLVIDPVGALGQLEAWAYEVSPDMSGKSVDEARRFLRQWIARTSCLYVMASLSPEFTFPDDSLRSRMFTEVVLPACREADIPLALMLGVRRQVNPVLRPAGDSVGRSDLGALANLCAAHPENRFLVTVLARENQHELCVLARKFSNLHPFGCWWFNNTPSIIDEITRMRLELLGATFTAQHSDARVVDQLIYKWDHSRTAIATVLADQFEALAASGLTPTEAEIRATARDLLGGSFRRFVGR